MPLFGGHLEEEASAGFFMRGECQRLLAAGRRLLRASSNRVLCPRVEATEISLGLIIMCAEGREGVKQQHTRQGWPFITRMSQQ